ncbi:MAG: MaoC family dehydratase [Bacteroidota bacterium]
MELIVADQIYETPLRFTQEQVNAFAEISGDKNPIHIDAEYAARTEFGRPVVHGIFGGCILSRVMGMEFPGPGSVYLSQSLRFRQPMFPGEDYLVRIKVTEVNTGRHIARLDTRIIRVSDGKPTLTGDAMVMNKERIRQADL